MLNFLGAFQGSKKLQGVFKVLLAISRVGGDLLSLILLSDLPGG